MKIPVTLLKAAIERHNQRARTLLDELFEEAYENLLTTKGTSEILAEANALNKKVNELAAKAKKLAGLELIDLTGSTCKNITLALGWQEKNKFETKTKAEITKKDPRCQCTSIDTVLLAAAAQGTDDIAGLLDSLKLNWR